MPLEAIEVRLLDELDIEVFDGIDPDVFDNPVQRGLAERYLRTPGNLLAVATQSGIVVGMASAIAFVHPDKPLQLFINEVGVADRMQGQGIGKRLMHALLEQGRTMGCTEAWVATEEDNSAARALYKSVSGKEDPTHAVVYTWSLLES
jgi:ribosomal protein S18 acetylase RimI-like enzyme